MSQPVPYDPTISFAAEEASQVAGRSTVRTTQLDVELANLALTITQLRANLAIIQRDDTQLRDGIVKSHSLAAEVLTLIGSSTGSRWTPRGMWTTATSYAVFDFVEQGGASYLCLVAHVSGVFATDLAAAKWMTIIPAAGALTFVPTATIEATSIQGAIEESDSDNRIVRNIFLSQDGGI